MEGVLQIMIMTLYNDNKKLKQQVTQLKYSNSEKDVKKCYEIMNTDVLRQNERKYSKK